MIIRRNGKMDTVLKYFLADMLDPENLVVFGIADH